MSVIQSLRALPRPIRVVCAATFVNRVGSMALPFLLLYLTKERHYTPEAAAAIIGVYGAGALVAGPLAGGLVNRFGARAIMVVSLCGGAVALFAVPWVSGQLATGALVFFWALTGESFRPAAAAVVAEHAAPEQRRNAYAALRLAVNLGLSIGPAFGGFLAERSYAVLFVIDGATSLAAAGCLALVGVGTAARSVASVAAADSSRQASGPMPLALHLLGVALIALVAYQGLSTMPLYMTETLGLDASAYGLVFALSGAIIVVCELPLTSRLSRWTHRRLLVTGAALTGLGFAALAGSATFAGVIATTFVWSTGEMLVGPATNARVADLEPPHRRGVYVGLHSAVWSAAFAFGPLLGMLTFTRLGPHLHWVVVGLTGLAAALVFSLSGRRRAAGQEEQK